MRQSTLDEYQHVAEPWKDERTLRRLYTDERLSMAKIADRLGCSSWTVHHYIHEFGIPIGDDRTRPPAKLIEFGGVERLRELYHEQGLTQTAIAGMAGVRQGTVSYWIRSNGLELTPKEAGERSGAARRRENPTIFTSEGYEHIYVNDGEGESHTVKVHRLLAVALYGFEAVVGNDVHHKNRIPWDNRPSNLEVLSPSEHMSLHASEEVVILRVPPYTSK